MGSKHCLFNVIKYNIIYLISINLIFYIIGAIYA